MISIPTTFPRVVLVVVGISVFKFKGRVAKYGILRYAGQVGQQEQQGQPDYPAAREPGAISRDELHRKERFRVIKKENKGGGPRSGEPNHAPPRPGPRSLFGQWILLQVLDGRQCIGQARAVELVLPPLEALKYELNTAC